MNNLLEITTYLEHYPSLLIVITTVAIFIVGITGHIFSNKTSIPSIIFLMIFGVILGKYGLNIINPDVYGKTGVRAITAFSVAIIVFEGGLLIDLKHLKNNLISITGLISTNVFLTIIGMTFVTTQLLGIDTKIALLYSALVSVTGPTVIAPILKKIHLSQKLKTILETEAVLVDAVGVITAASIFNYISLGENARFIDIFNNIFASIFIGIISGLICVFLTKVVISKFSPLSGEITRLIVLTLAIGSYVLGELLSHESGITSVAIAGIIVGNTDFPFKKSIKEFKGDLTLISITLVFLLLSSGLDISFLINLGFNGVLCILILMILIRPTGVFIATLFEKITWREKVFIAGLGPRGIVAASAATFFAVELESFGIEGSDTIRSMVFLTILVTVILEGGGAKFMAKILNIAPLSVLIFGGGTVGRDLVKEMQEKGESLIIIENNEKKVDRLLKEGVYVINADAVSEKTYKEKIDLRNVKSMITTSDDDWLNLRICQIVKNIRPDMKIISTINDVKSKAIFENIGIITISYREAIVNAITESILDLKPDIVENK